MASKLPLSAVAHPESNVKITSSAAFIEALQARRSIYTLDKNSPISAERIKEITEEIIAHVPSSFNSQPTRVILLFGDDHIKLWSGIIKEALKAIVPGQTFSTTEKKIDGFSGAFGTVSKTRHQILQSEND
jgi:predicted oxidoreductase (fatty acid repression mutant protein)